MGNYISKISKGHFFAFEEELKNEIFFFKGKTRSVIEMCARGIQKRLFHYKLGCGGETFFKQVRCIINNVRCAMAKGTP